MPFLSLNRQFVTFVLVGTLCAICDVGVLSLLKLSGVNYLVSVTFGFLTGLILNYLLHAMVTFNSAINNAKLIKFLIVVLMNYALTMFCVFQFNLLFGAPIFGKIVSLPLVAINGFILSKNWVYKK